MRYFMSLVFVLALAVMGCETTGERDVVETVEEMLVGRWWLDWDQSTALTTRDGVGLITFTADGWANYDIILPTLIPNPIPEWCRRYATWSLLDVVDETEFTYELSYAHDSCNREAGTAERFTMVLDQTDPPKGQATRLSEPVPGRTEQDVPIERCTTDVDASTACGFDTGLGSPTENPAIQDP